MITSSLRNGDVEAPIYEVARMEMPGTNQAQRSLRRLKWMMVVLPPVAVTIVHYLLAQRVSAGEHRSFGLPAVTAGSLIVLGLAVFLSWLCVEHMFQLVRDLQTQAALRQQELDAMEAVSRERERLGRELHDGVAQLVAQMLLRIDLVSDLLQANRQPDAVSELTQLRKIGDEMYLEIGESIADSRSSILERGLAAAIVDYAGQFEDRNRIETQVSVHPAANALSPSASFQVFRLVQEALSNVRKHACAHSVAISLDLATPDRLVLAIADDGDGFEPERTPDCPNHVGLTSMRERAHVLNGTFAIASAPGAGTRIGATIPLATREG